MVVHFTLTVQVPDQYWWHCGSLQVTIPTGWRLTGAKTRLRVLWALLPSTGAMGALRTCKEWHFWFRRKTAVGNGQWQEGSSEHIAYFAPFFFHSSHLSFFYLCSIPLSSIYLLLYLSYLLFLLNHLCPFQAKQIADNAFQFVVDNLLPDKLYCYLVTLFKASQQSSYWNILYHWFIKIWYVKCLIIQSIS